MIGVDTNPILIGFLIKVTEVLNCSCVCFPGRKFTAVFAKMSVPNPGMRTGVARTHKLRIPDAGWLAPCLVCRSTRPSPSSRRRLRPCCRCASRALISWRGWTRWSGSFTRSSPSFALCFKPTRRGTRRRRVKAWNLLSAPWAFNRLLKTNKIKTGWWCNKL